MNAAETVGARGLPAIAQTSQESATAAGPGAQAPVRAAPEDGSEPTERGAPAFGDGLGIRQVGAVAVVTLQRPERHNALSTALLEQFARYLRALPDESGASRPRVLVLTGAGRSFCSGADLHEQRELDTAARLRRRELFRRVVESLCLCPFPTVAAVHGYALGGGLELALACDLVVSAPDAVYGLPELSVGALPGGGAVHSLARRVGSGLAADLLLTGRRVTGTELAAVGGVDRLAAAGALEEAVELATAIAARPAELLELAVGMLRRTAHAGRSAALAVEEGYWWRALARG
jgi:enoyl-CoA hydratase/carnithine racemase